MDWTNERYVRVYVRDTADLMAVGWEGRAVLWEMMRKAERNGILDAEEDTLPELLRMPREVVSVGLDRLLARKVVEKGQIRGSDVYVIPNFMEAQEAVQSDKMRQAELRARRRASALEVTKRDAVPTKRDETVTKRDETVTRGHAASRDVTPCLAVPSCANTPAVGNEPSQLALTAQEPKAVKRPKRPKPNSTAWGIWRELWGAKHDATYVNADGDGRAMQRLAKRAADHAKGRDGDADDVLESVLRHWFDAYLDDPGTNGYLAAELHPLRTASRDLNKYGLPWSKPSGEPVKFGSRGSSGIAAQRAKQRERVLIFQKQEAEQHAEK